MWLFHLVVVGVLGYLVFGVVKQGKGLNNPLDFSNKDSDVIDSFLLTTFFWILPSGIFISVVFDDLVTLILGSIILFILLYYYISNSLLLGNNRFFPKASERYKKRLEKKIEDNTNNFNATVKKLKSEGWLFENVIDIENYDSDQIIDPSGNRINIFKQKQKPIDKSHVITTNNKIKFYAIPYVDIGCRVYYYNSEELYYQGEIRTNNELKITVANGRIRDIKEVIYVPIPPLPPLHVKIRNALIITFVALFII